MKLLIVFGTTDGQTAKIAKHMLETAHNLGHTVALERADGDDLLTPDGFDAVVLAGSVHAGRYQQPLAEYARNHATALSDIPSLFISVSLTAAGAEREDWDELVACSDRFAEETGWQPGRVEQVAGAFKFNDYSFFTYWAMRWIARQKDQSVGAHENREYTDWEELDRIVEEWTAAVTAGNAA